ncbi:MAG TPA: NAD(P)/FAD-dependent oxidoreductase, partial [Trueperaceae bacterium]|nr:NAD(P)/FAD-dependent oxidoreductase [Trueperaceae bacterium]
RQVRAIFRRQGNLAYRQGRAVAIDLEDRVVALDGGGRLPFDYLVLAPGAVSNDFGVPGVREHAFFLKTLTEAVNLRSRVLEQFERATRDAAALIDGSLTFVIAGGGPTGVELAGALAELCGKVLVRDFPMVPREAVRVVLLEMRDHLLDGFGSSSQRYARQLLERRGVEVRLGAAVEAVHGDRVALRGSVSLACRTVIWVAGVRGEPLAGSLGVPLAGGGRVPTAADLSLPRAPRVFVAGDLASPPGSTLPQTAPVAIQEGRHAGADIARRLQGRPARAFRYLDKGRMAIIGRSAGIAELSPRLLGVRARGHAGWLAWLLVHLVYLPGYRNRVGALLDWAHNYLTWERHTRLITPMVPSPGDTARRDALPGRAPRARRELPECRGGADAGRPRGP